MGAYLSTPLVDKLSSDETNEFLDCGASQMQGWRMSQEDAHICTLDFDKVTSLFAVFDGHGGSEVALYCAQKLPEFLKNTDAYKKGDYEQALKDAFIGFDGTLVQEEIIEELKKLIPAEKDGETETEDGDLEDEEEDLVELCQEGRMPLNELLEKYKESKLNPIIKLKKGEASGSKPVSPFLRGRRNGTNSENLGESSIQVGSSIRCSKIKIDVTEEEAVTSSSAPTSAYNKNEHSSVGEASSSSFVAGSSGSSSQEKSSKTATNDDSENCNSNGPTSSSSTGNSLKIDSSIKPELDGTKNDCNSPDSSSTINKGLDNSAEAPASSSAETSEVATENKQPVNGAETTSVKYIKVDSEVSEVSTYSFKGESVSSSSTSVVSVENGVVSSNAEPGPADKCHHKISSTKECKSKNLPLIDDDSNSDDDDDEDGSYNEEKSSTEEEDEECEMEESDEEDETEDDDGLYPEDEDEDDGFLNNMHEGPGSSSGCTAVMALLCENELYVANAGDSRCVICRNGKAVDMSLDHKPEDKEELERIRKAGGRVTLDGRVNGGLNLSRAIGDHAYKMNKDLKPEEQMISALPDIKKLTIGPDDEFMILACDGIWNSLSSEEVVEFVKKRILNGQTKMSVICEELFTKCLAPNTLGDGTGCDNMTAVIVRFKPLLIEQYGKSTDEKEVDITTSSSASRKRSASPGENDGNGDSSIDNDTHKRIKTDSSGTNSVVEPTST